MLVAVLSLLESGMTDKEKESIAGYRRNGLSYARISKATGFSINTIKSYCRRNGLVEHTISPETITFCEHCGEAVSQRVGRKHKRFCSDRCRILWWNAHHEEFKRKAEYSYICPSCGKSFTAYGNRNRKYCSHECYISHRYGGKA